MGDPADQSVYSVDTFSRRCEGLDFSSDRIYCWPCPQLLSTIIQSACSIINILKLHIHTDWRLPLQKGGEEINLHRIFLIQPEEKCHESNWALDVGHSKVRYKEIVTQVKSQSDSSKQKLHPLNSYLSL